MAENKPFDPNEKIPGVNTNYRHTRDHIEDCEAGDGHLVQPTVWPPTSSDGSMGLQCVICKCHVVVYADEAKHSGIRIDLSKTRKVAKAS
jgi:hypothetical protein